MDELQCVGVGVALGVIIVSFLTFYPGESFDYIVDCNNICLSDRKPPTNADNFANSPPQQKSLTECEANKIQQQQQIAEIEQVAQLVKIQKLQELLGLEKKKAHQLVQRAKEEAKLAVNEPHSYPNNKSAWLDRGFFTVMFGLLVWVLWQDYNINLLSVAAHFLPREAEVLYQIVAVSRGFVSKLVELWKFA